MQVIEHIEIQGHEAVIQGTTLKAKMVARMYLWDNKSVEEVMGHYGLSAAEVHAAIAFYYDNREALDAEYQQNMELIKQVGTSSQDFRAKIEARRKQQEE